MAKAREKPAEARAIPIRRTNPLGLRPTFVNDCTVTHTGSEFYLTFGQIEPPAPAQGDALDQLEGIDSVAVAKLLLTPQFMDTVITVLSENFEKFRERKT